MQKQQHQPKPTPIPRQIHTAPRTLPPIRPDRPLQPAPKPGQGNQPGQEPTTQEWAAFGRAMYAAIKTMRDGYRLIEQGRQRQNQLVAEMVGRVGGSGGSNSLIAECEFCHERHEGACNV